MPPLMQLPGYQYPNNALINFQPVSDAIDSNRQNALMQDANAIKREHLGMERRKLAMAETKSEEERQHRLVQNIGRMSQVIDDMPDGPQRRAAWQNVVRANNFGQRLTEHGIDPNDHVNGPRFLVAQAGEFDPWKRKVQQAQIEAHGAAAASSRAHAGYYQAGADALRAKAAPQVATGSSIDDYRIDRSGEVVGPGGSPRSQYNFNPADATPYNPSSDRFSAPMRLGGPTDDIDASMRLDEGRPRGGPPRGVRLAQVGSGLGPSLMDQAKVRAQTDPAAPNADNLNPLGLSNEGMKDVVLSNELTKHLGKPKVGHVWTIGENGRPVQKKVDEKGPSSKDMSPEQIQFNLKNLNDTFKVLVGSTDDKGHPSPEHNPSGFDLWYGAIASDASKWKGSASIPGSIITNMAGTKQTGFRQAFDAANHSAYNLLVALSGKSFSKAELEYVLPFFTPTASDNREMRAFKLQSAHRLFSSLAEAQRRGASNEQRAQIFESTMSQMARAVPDNKAPPQQPEAPQQANPTQQRLKNKYGLE